MKLFGNATKKANDKDNAKIKMVEENCFKQFCYMQGELSEAFEAYNKNLNTLGEELADVCLYILGFCEIKGIDLENEILKKLEVIKKRKYVKINGSMIREEKLTEEQRKMLKD